MPNYRIFIIFATRSPLEKWSIQIKSPLEKWSIQTKSPLEKWSMQIKSPLKKRDTIVQPISLQSIMLRRKIEEILLAWKEETNPQIRNSPR